MTSRRFTVFQKLMALAPLLLMAVYLPGQVMLRCRMDGLLRPACCCPRGSALQASLPVLKPADCCDREITASAQPPVEARATTTPESQLGWTTAVVATIDCVALVDSLAYRAERSGARHGPPRDGPPIVLLKHAFLI